MTMTMPSNRRKPMTEAQVAVMKKRQAEAKTPEGSKKLEAEAVKVIEKSRAIARKVVPYLEAGIDALAFVFVHGSGATFACDRKYRVFCDPAFVVAMGPNAVVSDILHEKVVHLMGDHFTRADEAKIPPEDRSLWNTAGDAAGNGTLFEIAAESGGLVQPMGVKIDGKNLREEKLKTCMVTPENLGLNDGLTVEEYFQKLKEKQEEGGGGGGDKEPGDGDPGDGGGQSGGDPGDGPRTCGGCAGDDDSTDKLKQKAREQGQDVPDGKSPVEHESIKQREALAIEQHTQGRGTAPAGLTRWAKMVRQKPKVNWRKHLAATVSRGIGKARGQQDFTQQKLRNRQSILLPTMYAPQPVVAMVLDTSGSMSGSDLGASLREVKGVFDVLQQGGASEVHIVACDTRATKPVKLKKWSEAKVQSLLVGGGGTDMGAGLEGAAKVRPSITVVCTDGDTGWPHSKPKNSGKVIVALTRPTTCPTPSWASVVKAFDQKD